MVGAGCEFDSDGGYASPKQSPPATGARSLLSPRNLRLQSPTLSHFPLGANDDQLERAQSRAAARSRRKSIVFAPIVNPLSDVDGDRRCDMLDRVQIMDLFQNCIKLSSENKINQKNTWELSLIDHLSEVIRAQQPEDDDETNFQKASCTLEAGVKIYSMRVDSVHSEAYKVLGGINRAGRGEEVKDNLGEGDYANATQGDGASKKETERKISPLSTLESSFEALNVKKIDVAFVVDPLYHQTSAQFDEGGAKGLLLNNLGVYGGCRVLFDSFENPESCTLLETTNCKPEVIDLSFVKDHIEKMIHVPATNDITPTLRQIVKNFDEDNCRPADINISTLVSDDHEDHFENNHMGVDENVCDYECEGSFNFEPDDPTGVIDEISADMIQIHTEHQEENFENMFDGPDVDEKFEKIAGFLSLGLGFTSKSNAWAGPDHWKYRKAKGTEKISVSATESEVTEKKSKSKKGIPDIEFTKSLDNEMPDVFAPPKNPKSLLLPTSKVIKNVTLPEDCHYRPESLLKLFLLSHVLCTGKKRKNFFDESRDQNVSSSPFQSWDNGSITNDHFEDENAFSDEEDQGSLISQPRQVNKVEIQYDKVSKQVDVHVLKDVLWSNIQGSISSSSKDREAKVSLKHILQHFPDDCPAAPSKDISPHLFFICLLHLANEHCLSLDGHPGLDELDIHIPSSAFVN